MTLTERSKPVSKRMSKAMPINSRLSRKSSLSTTTNRSMSESVRAVPRVTDPNKVMLLMRSPWAAEALFTNSSTAFSLFASIAEASELRTAIRLRIQEIHNFKRDIALLWGISTGACPDPALDRCDLASLIRKPLTWEPRRPSLQARGATPAAESRSGAQARPGCLPLLLSGFLIMHHLQHGQSIEMPIPGDNLGTMTDDDRRYDLIEISYLSAF